MKIKKSPPKKLISPPTKIQQLVEKLTNCPENELHKVIVENSPWKNQKSDLYHWISVLNRFDIIFESINQKYELKHIQVINFDEDTKNLLLSIITFTRYLWENCINRNIYNSYEHLNLLLNTNDIDVLEALLRLMLKFAQRLGNNNSKKIAFALSIEKIYTLYHTWISNDFNLTYSQLINPDTKLPDECFTLSYRYYKSGKQAAQAQQQIQNVTQKVETLTSKHSKSSLKHKVSLDGLISINLNKSQLFEKSTQEIYNELVANYDIPAEHKYSIYHRIRFLKSINDYNLRLKYITIRLFALSIYVQMVEEDTATSKVFVYEPDLISNIAEILQSDNPNTYGIQTAILSVLDGIIRFKSKNTFVLAAINSSTNYGILSFIFRKVIKNLDMDEMEIPQEFVDIFFTLVSYIISLQNNTNTLAMQVTVNLLISALENTRLDRYKNLTKCIILLDNFILIKNQVFPVFIEENGLDKVLNRIKYEVDYNVKLIEDANAKSDQNMEDAVTGKEVFPRDEKDGVPHESMVLLRASLKLILHLMQTSGSSDRMRNLIDSSLASSLYKIFKYYDKFGILVYGLTIEIMSTFIHNEPTCLNILQEAKLPQMFLETVNKGVLVSAEAINEIPTAFGAVCLNSAGMKQFNEAKPADKYFEIFTSEEYMRVFLGNYIVVSIGNGIDELLRHHPDIKIDIIKSMIKMINKLMDENSTAPLENTTGIYLYNVEDEKNKIKTDEENQKSESENYIPVFLQQLSLCFKFLDGVFQNNYHRTEFIDNGGLDAILKFYTLPYIPFNLIATPASFYCSKNIKTLVESNKEKVLPIIINKLIGSLEEINSKIDNINEFSFDKYINIKDEETLKEGNEIMHSMISALALTELLNDLFSINNYSIMNQFSALKESIMSKPEVTQKLIKLISKFNCLCSWDFLKLRYLNNPLWFDYIENYKFSYGKKLMKSDISEYMLSSLNQKNKEVDMNKLESEIDVGNPAFKNYKYLQFILKRYIITSITLHESISKVLMGRKGSDDESKRKIKFQFIDTFGECILNTLNYPYNERAVNELHNLNFINMYLSLISRSSINERSSNYINIQFAKLLTKKENFEIINKMINDLWCQNIELNQRKKVEKDNKEALALIEEELDLNNKGISKIMNLFIYLSSFDAINTSSYLHYILSFEEGKTNGFIVFMRYNIIQIILNIWKDDNLKNCPPEIINEMIFIIKNLLKANGENIAEIKTFKPPMLFQKPLRQPVVPKPEHMDILIDMGFPRKACEKALIECSNNISRATDYLLNHPELVEESEEPASTTAQEGGPSISNNNNDSTEANASTSGNPNSTTESAQVSENNGNGESSSANPVSNTEDVPMENTEATNNNDNGDNNSNNNSTSNDQSNENSSNNNSNNNTNANASFLNDIFNEFGMVDEADRDDLSRALEMSLETSVNSFFNNIFPGFEAEKPVTPRTQEINDTRNKLNELRETLKNDVESWLYTIMDFAEESISNIKSLLLSLTKEKSQVRSLIKKVISDIENYHANNNLYTQGERSRYRILLKFITDPNYKTDCFEEIKDLINSSINMFINEPNDEHLEWLMPTLLLIDNYFVYGKTNLELLDEEERSEDFNKGLLEKLDGFISKDLQFKIIEKIIFFMNNYEIKSDILHCFYRLIIELIYDYSIAQYFISMNGLKALFRSKTNTSAELFQGQNNLIIIILRHLVEQPQILKELLKKEIYLHLNRVRQSTTDIKGYIMTLFPYVVDRNPKLFIEATVDICKLTSSNPDSYITLHKKYVKRIRPESDDEDDDDDDESNEDNENEENEEGNSSNEDNKSPISPVKTEDGEKGKMAETKKILDEIDNELVKSTEPVINFLIEEFLNCRNMSSVSSLNEVLQLPEIQNLTNNNKMDITTTNSNSSLNENPVEKEKDIKMKAAQEKISKEKNLILNEHAFIIQCLTELVFCYPSCKMNLINYCKDHKKLGSKKLITYLIEEYIFNDLVESNNDDESQNPERSKHKFRYIESNIIIKLFYNLLSTDSYDFEKLQDYSIDSVRKNVIEALGQCMKNSINRQGTLEQKYRYYSGLAKLCLKLVNFKAQRTSKKIDEFTLAIAKLMLENNFVILLTNMVSDIDVNHPQCSNIIYNIIKPLDLLILAAIEINKNSETTTVIQVQEEENPNAPVINVESEAPHDEEHEITDMYRTSALGIFSGENEDEDEEDEDEEDIEGEDEYDEDDYEEDGFIGTEEDMSDDSEASDIEDITDEDEDEEDPDVEMEIVMRPYDNENDDNDEDEDDNEEDDIEEIEVDADDEVNDGNEEMLVQNGIDNPEVIIVDENNNQMRWETPYSINEDDMSIDNMLQNNEIQVEIENNGSELGSGNTEILRADDEDNHDEDNDEVEVDEDEDDEDDEDNELNDDEEGLDDFLNAEEDDEDLLGYDRRFVWNSDERQENLTREQENWLNGRSGVMEIQLSPQGIEFRLPNSSDPRNIESILRALDSRVMQPQTNNNEINAHPLLSGRSNTNDESENRIVGDQGSVGNRTLHFMERLFQEISPSFVNSLRGQIPSSSTLFLSNEEQMNDNVNKYNIMNTQKRWKQEHRYLNITPNKNYYRYIQRCIVKQLLPNAIEEEKKRKEEEERKRKIEEEKKRKQMEEERKRQEEERKKKEEEEEKARQQRLQEQSESATNENGDVVMTDNNNQGNSSNEQAPERVTVMVNGREVDITNTGIDPTFLEALPDDLRQEIIEQHISETRVNQTSNATLSANEEFNNEFLYALPNALRAEVMEFGGGDRRGTGRQRTSQGGRSPFGMGDSLFNFYYDNGSNMGSPFYHKKPVTKKKIIKEKKELSQLLEKPALSSIIRLLFINKGSSTVEAIQKILSNLSKNSKTRNEVISILLCILIDGSSDLADVDKNFAQMSIKNKGKASTKKSSSSSITTQHIHSSNDYVPNLVAKRSLDTLIYLVAHNDQVRQYFLTPNENINVNLTRKPSLKKLKGKEKITTSKYPIVILLSLLDRPTFLSNPILMEKTTFLLSQILRSLNQTQADDKEENKEKKTDSNDTNNDQHETTEATSTSANANANSNSNETTTNAGTSSGSKSTNSKNTKSPSIHIPIHYCNSIVNIFIASECTIKTFQNTLIILQNITSMKEYYNTIIHQLVHAVQKIIDSIQDELIELTKTLSDEKIEVQKLTFHDLTSASSKQAQILRILKAIDFLETKRLNKSKNNSTEENEDKMQDVTPTSNNKTSKEESASVPSNKKLANKPTEDELLHIYNQLHVKPLWSKLSNILTIINKNRNLIHVATILLPLIESFMVISKPYVLNNPEKYQNSAQLLNKDTSNMENQTNEEIFYSMTDEHRKILNAMVRNNPSLMKNSFALLVSNSKILDFDNKRTYFNQQLHKRNNREHYGTLQIAVRRQYVFEDSFHKLQGKTGNEIKYSKLNVRFADEEGVDVGGVTREWFSALARQMFNPNYALFKPSAQDRVTYQPNRNSWINPDHLSFFKFVGRIIGKAIYDGRALDCYFTRSFYKHILNITVDYKDIEAIDPEYFKSLEWILHNDITDVLDLTFSLEIDEFGKKSIVDLKPDGRNIAVTEDNKVEYVKLVTEQKLTVAIKQQIEAFLEGFHDIIPHSLISIFNEQELELLISGLPEIDIDDWKNNTVYENYNSSSPQVQWFWRAVRSFTQEERAKLIQFTTGTSKVPLEGFSNLQGSNGIQKFQIHKDFGSIERLPSAHTCFNQLDIPAYESYEHLRKALLLAINECSVGFGFA